MRVVTQDESFKLPGAPYVYPRVTMTDGARAAHIELELRRNALLTRDRQPVHAVGTWRTGYIFANPTAQAIRDKIKDQVDEFLNAWLSVNPKK